MLRIYFLSDFSLDVVVVRSWHHFVQFPLEKGSPIWNLFFVVMLRHMEFLIGNKNSYKQLTFVLKVPSLYVVCAKCPPLRGILNLSKLESKFLAYPTLFLRVFALIN